MSVFQQIQKVREELHIALQESKALGERYAVSKAKYEGVKSRCVLELKEQGYSASIIEQIIKGVPEVNDALLDVLTTEVQYKNACEAINVWKKEYDYLREQYQREWSQSGWSDR